MCSGSAQRSCAGARTRAHLGRRCQAARGAPPCHAVMPVTMHHPISTQRQDSALEECGMHV